MSGTTRTSGIDFKTTEDIHPSTTIATSLSIYFTMFLLGWIIFELIQRGLRDAYNCRSRRDETSCPTVENSYGILGWIPTVFRISDDEIFEWCGLDTLVFLRFLRLGQKLALCGVGLSFYLFPWYATGTNPHEDEREEIDPLERITMSNLSNKEFRIWGSVVAMYIMTAFAMYLFLEEYKVYVKRRHEFLGRFGPQQYSVVINDVPKHLRTNVTLRKYMEFLFPNDVHSVHVAVECAKLEKKIERRVEVRNALEHALAVYGSTGNRPMHRTSKCGGNSIDTINSLQADLTRLNDSVAAEIREIEMKEQEVMNHLKELARASPDTFVRDYILDNDVTGDGAGDAESKSIPLAATAAGTTKAPAFKNPMRMSAFVCFKTLKAAQTAQQFLQTANPYEMQVKGAPHPRDIVWENIGLPRKQRWIWEMVSSIATVAIIFFWTIPTAFVASLATVESLQKLIPPLKDAFDEYPKLIEVVKQLPPLLLIAMTLLASYIFGILSRREGHPSATMVMASHFNKLVYFLVIQIFFVSVISGTVSASLEKIIDDPKSIVSFLGNTMPAQSTTFMTYLIVQIGLKLTIELLRVVPLVLGFIYSTAAPKLTRRERTSEWIGLKPASEPGEFIQTVKLPDFFLGILLIFAFCAIAPLLCYFAGIYLLLADLVYRRQVLFVYDPSTFSTGVFWPKLHDCLCGALLLAQVTFLGLVSLKLAPGPIFFATILPFFTIAYFLHVNSFWPRTAQNLPLLSCCHLDKARANEGSRDADLDAWRQAYLQPALGQGPPLGPEYDENGRLSSSQLVSPTSENTHFDDRDDDSTGDVLP